MGNTLSHLEGGTARGGLPASPKGTGSRHRRGDAGATKDRARPQKKCRAAAFRSPGSLTLAGVDFLGLPAEPGSASPKRTGTRHRRGDADATETNPTDRDQPAMLVGAQLLGQPLLSLCSAGLRAGFFFTTAYFFAPPRPVFAPVRMAFAPSRTIFARPPWDRNGGRREGNSVVREHARQTEHRRS